MQTVVNDRRKIPLEGSKGIGRYGTVQDLYESDDVRRSDYLMQYFSMDAHVSELELGYVLSHLS